MKYYLKPHVTDEMLQAVGFKISNEIYKNATRITNNQKLYIGLVKGCSYTFGVRCIEFALGNRDKYSVRNYIKDLIKLDYVEVRNERD